VNVRVCGNAVSAAGAAAATPCSTSGTSPTDVAGASVARALAGGANALAFTGSATTLLTTLGAGLAALGLAIRRLAGVG
jgi:hypothetical protein